MTASFLEPALARPLDRPAPERPFDRSNARGCALAQRLTPEWQDERGLLDGLKSAEIQFFLVTRTGIAERRRLGGIRCPVRWQLRLRA